MQAPSCPGLELVPILKQKLWLACQLDVGGKPEPSLAKRDQAIPPGGLQAWSSWALSRSWLFARALQLPATSWHWRTCTHEGSTYFQEVS